MTEDDDAENGTGAEARRPGDDREPATYSTQRYLAAKRTVDDRALDEGVLDRLARSVPNSPAVLEVGAGIGTMVERLLDRGLLSGAVTYVAVDLDAASVAAARERLPERARAAGYEVRRPADDPASFVFERDGAADGPERLTLTLRVADAVAVADAIAGANGDRVDLDDGTTLPAPAAGFDLLVGAAFLDLLSWPAVETLVGAVRPGGHCYFPITFDGTTTFAPAPDPEFERRLERAFHAHLDAGAGTSRAGRRTLDRLPDADVDVVAAAGSDWNVSPATTAADAGAGARAGAGAGRRDPVPGTARYSADEAYFLHHLVELVRGALSSGPETADAGAETDGDESAGEGESSVDAERVERWARRRHAAVARGELRYLTHQVDVLGRRRG